MWLPPECHSHQSAWRAWQTSITARPVLSPYMFNMSNPHLINQSECRPYSGCPGSGSTKPPTVITQDNKCSAKTKFTQLCPAKSTYFPLVALSPVLRAAECRIPGRTVLARSHNVFSGSISVIISTLVGRNAQVLANTPPTQWQ